MASYRNSKVIRSASDGSACSLALQECFKRKCHGSPTRVTVTNGEIASVISRHDSFNDSASTLERLRSFTAGEPEYPPYLSTESFDGGIFSEEDSVTSFDHHTCDDWVRTDTCLNNSRGKSRAGFLNGNNKLVDSADYKKYYRKSGANGTPHSAVKSTKQQQSRSRDPFNGLQSTYFDMESANLNSDQTWKAQREAFWSVKQELASTLDFDKILPELLKFNFFTSGQLRVYSNFQPGETSHASKGINESKILHAVSERVDEERSAMPMLLLSLRKHQPTVADMLQHKIFSIKSQRDFHKSEARRTSYTVSAMESAQKLDSDLMYAGSQSPSTSKCIETSEKFPPITSRYSRRPMTINSSRDYEHMELVRKKHNLRDPSSSPYFSKFSLASNVTRKIDALPNKYSPIPKSTTAEKTVAPKQTKSPKRKYVKFQEKLLGNEIDLRQKAEDHDIKEINCQEIKDKEKVHMDNNEQMNRDDVSTAIKISQETKEDLIDLTKDESSDSPLKSVVEPENEDTKINDEDQMHFPIPDDQLLNTKYPLPDNQFVAPITKLLVPENNTDMNEIEESTVEEIAACNSDSLVKDNTVESIEPEELVKNNVKGKICADPPSPEDRPMDLENIPPQSQLPIKNEIIIETVPVSYAQSLPLAKAEKPNLKRPPPPLPSKHERPKTHVSKSSRRQATPKQQEASSHKAFCKSTLYVTPTTSLPSDVIVKRSSSCRLGKSSRPTVSNKSPDAMVGKILNMELPGLEHVARPRSSSLVAASVNPKTFVSKSDEEINEKLSQLSKRYRDIGRTDCCRDVKAFDITSLPAQVDSLIAELTNECVISTRSAWLLRKMPAPSARVSGFVDVLNGLNDHDASDVIERCTITSHMLKTVCAESDCNVENEKGKSNDKPKESSPKSSTLTTTLISPSANKPRFSPVDYDQENSSDNIKKSNKNPAAVKENALVKLASNEILRCEVKMKEMNDQSEDDINCLQIVGGHLAIQDDNISKNTPNDTKICNICQRPGKLSPGQVKERGREKRACERTVSVTSSKIVTDLVRVKPIDSTASDSICSDTESAVSASSDTDSLSSLGRSGKQYSRLGLQGRRASARKRLERSTSNQQGSYISKVLFPISTRKNSLRKTKSLDGTEADTPEIKTGEADIRDKEESDIVQDISDKMPPVLPLTTSKQAENRLNEELLIKETVAQSDLFQFKAHQRDKDVNFDDVINDVNNNDVVAATPEKHSSQLTTILTNGSRSPPSSFKKKSNRVSFSDLPPIEIDLDDVTTPPPNSTSTPENESRNDLPKIDLTKIDASQSVRKDSPMPNDLTPKKTNHKSHKQESRDKEMSPSNEIDQINELLMDILEEIEAESISLHQCLDDLVTKNLLSDELAQAISPCYVQYKSRSVFFDGSFLAESPRDQLSEVERERAVEKLLDVLTNLGLETLRKCRNCILGRLCQLSTYEDFETAQKAAVAASESNSSASSSDDSDVAPPEEIPVESSEFSHHPSATKPEPGDTIRHRIQYYDVTNTSLSVQEEKEEREIFELSKPTPAKPNKIPKVSSLVPILIDEEAIEAKTAWVILGAGREDKQRNKLREALAFAPKNKMDKILNIPGLEGLQALLRSDNSDLQIRPSRPRSAPCLEPATSLDLNQTPPTRKESSDVFGGRLTRTLSERHPEGSARLFYRSSGGGCGLNSVGKENQRHNETGENFIDAWCRSHNLTSQSTTVLKNNGYNEPAHLYDITEDGIERLDGLSWLEKAKIWLAIENSRLTNNLRLSKRQGISDIYKII